MLRVCSFLLLASLASVGLRAAELRVAVAANFLGTLQRLAPLYERASGDRLLPSAASSGQLYAQIASGAPFDVFLSADAERPAALARQGKAQADSRCTYALGRLALWSPVAGRIDADGRFLDRHRFKHLAIADPELAPYGAAARELLMARGLWQELSDRHQLVIGLSITQAMQYAAAGAADAALVSLAQVRQLSEARRGSWWLPPTDTYRPIVQDGIAISARAGASAFLHWLCGDPAALTAIRAAGYGTQR